MTDSEIKIPMTDQEKLALIEKKYKKLYAGLFGIKPFLDKPYPDDERWTPWTRFVEPRLKMMSEAFKGVDIGELAAMAEIAREKK